MVENPKSRKKRRFRKLTLLSKESNVSPYFRGYLMDIAKQHDINLEFGTGYYYPRGRSSKRRETDIIIVNGKGTDELSLAGFEIKTSYYSDSIELDISSKGDEDHVGEIYSNHLRVGKIRGSKLFQITPKDPVTFIPPLVWTLEENNACDVIMQIIQLILTRYTFKPTKLYDVIGMETIIQDCLEMTNINLRKDKNLANRNIMFVGQHGLGKSLLMRALANELKSRYKAVILDFTSSDQMEQWLPIISQLANAINIPIVVCLDEIDEIALTRNNPKSNVFMLLRLIDGMAELDNVIFIATTNRPQDLDVALVRPERFSPIIHIDAPTAELREKLFMHYLQKHYNIDKIPKEWIIKTDGWSGADIRYVIENAIYRDGEIKNLDIISQNIDKYTKEMQKRDKLLLQANLKLDEKMYG